MHFGCWLKTLTKNTGKFANVKCARHWYSVGQFDVVNFRSTDELIPTSWPCCPLWGTQTTPQAAEDYKESCCQLSFIWAYAFPKVTTVGKCYLLHHSAQMFCVFIMLSSLIPNFITHSYFPILLLISAPVKSDIQSALKPHSLISSSFLLGLAGIFSGLELWLWSLLMWLTT